MVLRDLFLLLHLEVPPVPGEPQFLPVQKLQEMFQAVRVSQVVLVIPFRPSHQVYEHPCVLSVREVRENLVDHVVQGPLSNPSFQSNHHVQVDQEYRVDLFLLSLLFGLQNLFLLLPVVLEVRVFPARQVDQVALEDLLAQVVPENHRFHCILESLPLP